MLKGLREVVLRAKQLNYPFYLEIGSPEELLPRYIDQFQVGTVVKGTVHNVVDFGAFVNVLPGKDGLVHISQIDNKRVEKVTDYVKMDDVVKVKVLEVDPRGRIKLSMKDLIEDESVAG